MRLLIMTSILLLSASCAVSKKKLSEDGEKVKIISHAGDNCSAIDKVTGINENGVADLAQNHARNLAARAGGNAILMETVGNGNMIKVNGTVYNCKK